MQRIVNQLPKGASIKSTKLTLSLLILKKCTNHKIAGEIIKMLHFIDLQILIISIEIDKLTIQLGELRQKQLNEKGIDKIVDAEEDDFNSL